MVETAKLIKKPDLDSRIQAIQEDGYTYFPKSLTPKEVTELKKAMDEMVPVEESFNRNHTAKREGFINRHINNAFNHNPIFLKFLDRPDVIELAEALHGKDCHIIGMTAWVTGPGRPDQQLHCDWLPLKLPEDILSDPRVNLPVWVTTTHYYLNDLYEDLGPTKFIPGSHKSGRSPNGDKEWNGIGDQSIMCNAGDALTFRCEVWHRGTSNKSDETRYLLQVHYANRMITQKFPPYLNKFQFDPDILAQCNQRQLRLLGDHTGSNYD